MQSVSPPKKNSQIDVKKWANALFQRCAGFWKSRPDSEHEQALIRLGVGLLIVAYLLITQKTTDLLSGNNHLTIITVGVFFCIASIIICWIFFAPGVCVSRRIMGIITDNVATTSVFYFNGMLGAPLFVVYLWVAFGNGFRYGVRYLALSSALGVLGFSIIIMNSQELQSTPYMSGGLLIGLVVLPLYVSSLLRKLHLTLELAESANRAKSTFLATMSHEIRTPLNGLVGITELLSKTTLKRKQKQYVDMISSSSEWLMRVITDGLDFSKIEAGEFILGNDPFDLPGCLDELCSIYSGVHNQKKVVFIKKISENLPKVVVGDQLRLVQVLANLLNNAFNFTKEGYVLLHVEESDKSRDGVVVNFVVEDTGIGIPVEEQKKVFEPFKQSHLVGESQSGGTGLGLAIADRLVKLMGGNLQLESEGEGGCRFYFKIYFPYAATDFKNGSDHDLTAEDIRWSRSPCILLVEDQEINREVVIHQLEDLQCRVMFATNGEEALKRIEKEQFDLVLMDCQMPVLDGYQATLHIRQREEENQLPRTPIIALTAHVTMDDRRKCLGHGMDDYLGKPFRTYQLKAKLIQWLADLIVEVGSVPDAITTENAEPEEKPSLPQETKEKVTIHDLKNVLFVIQASAEMLENKGATQSDTEDNIERINAAVQRAEALLDGLQEALRD